MVGDQAFARLFEQPGVRGEKQMEALLKIVQRQHVTRPFIDLLIGYQQKLEERAAS